MPSERLRVLVLVNGELGPRVSGPAIRGWQLARALTRDHDVTVACDAPPAPRREGIALVPATRRRLVREALRHDAIVAACLPPYLLALKPWRRLLAVSDQYDPVELELATLGSERRSRRQVRSARAVRRLALRHADIVLCAGERQREALERELADVRRTGPLAPRVAVVPFGIPDDPPVTDAQPLRARFPSIAPDDRIVLWWGSIWRWLDAETAIRAFAEVVAARPEAKLVLTTGPPPQRDTERHAAAASARAVAESLGLANRSVHFLDEWVPYEERHLYLREADVGLTLHRGTPEARVAARARYMDYLWSGLPCVLARGDETADRFAAAGFARLVGPGDADATAGALRELLSPGVAARARGARAALAEAQRWDVVTRPLLTALAGARAGDARSPARAAGLLTGAGSYYARRAVDRLGRAAGGPAG